MDFSYKDEQDNHRGFTPEELLRAGHRTDDGAKKRYDDRLQLFVSRGGHVPRLRHHLLWMLHNCVAHPLLTVPTHTAVEFHELTSQWLNAKTHVVGGSVRHGRGEWRLLRYSMPKVERTVAWAIHNLVAHTMIGLAPCKPTFKFHDWTARLMDVPGWV